MHIEFLVEEPSMEITLSNIIPKLLGNRTTYNIHPFQGKPDLLKKLPSRLEGYSRWITEDYCIVVIIDRDKDDCYNLKNMLENYALIARLKTKSRALNNNRFQVLNRLVIQELESWFFGDIYALRKAYPRISSNLNRKSQYRDPDNMPFKPSQALARLLTRHGYIRNPSFFSTKKAAQKISCFLEPSRNQSRSFQVFCAGLLAIKLC